jgi:glutamate carboxypeptidase
MDMQEFKGILDSIAPLRGPMIQRLIAWSNINTGTGNVAGIMAQLKAIVAAADPLGGKIEILDLPPFKTLDSRGNEIEKPLGPALSIIKRPDAPLRIFLCIHCDTVYPPDSPFQTAAQSADFKTIHGPGVADAKGGLIVLLTALEAFEKSDFAETIGWEVLINPDEEIGSPGSTALFTQAAKRNHVGLLFEPALSDGSLVDRRKGSGNFSLLIRGRSAHAGRDFAAGRSAMVAGAEAVVALHALNTNQVTINIGSIDGGGPPNVVPDLAIVRFNCRTTEAADEQNLQTAFDRVLKTLNSRDGITATLHGQFAAPPKIPTPAIQNLLNAALACAKDLGITVTTRPSGGTCDGNRLAALGLPNIDTLGVVGGNIHSPDEYMITSSLVERAQLATLLLLRIAAGEVQIQKSEISHAEAQRRRE